jgi:hypothetical protein
MTLDVDEATAWVRTAVPGTERLRLVHEEPWASVFTADTSRGAVWFKACAPTHAFEVPLTAVLASRWPATTAEILAHDVDRRWLLMADAGEPLRTLHNPPEAWERLLPTYAAVQIGESSFADEHLGNGVPDLRVELLPALFDGLIDTPLPLEASERAALADLAPRFAERCAELDVAGIGPSVQHDDLHMNNVYVKGGKLRVLDWGDASIGHPFFSLFEVFRFLREVNRLPPDDPWFTRLRDVYLEPWGGDRRALYDVTHAVGGLAHAIAWLRQRQALPSAERPAFDVAFSRILRIAIAGMDERRR